MEWIDIGEAAEGCKDCDQMDCYNCETAGERWVLSVEDDLRTRKNLMVRAVERLQRQIAEIDAQLEKLRK